MEEFGGEKPTKTVMWFLYYSFRSHAVCVCWVTESCLLALSVSVASACCNLSTTAS